MIYTNKEIAKKFIAMLSSNLYEAENTMFDLAYQSVRQRVATVLIKQIETESNGTKNVDATPVVSVPRKDLSKMVGTSTESLNRTLADFKDEGLIEIQDKGLKNNSALKTGTRKEIINYHDGDKISLNEKRKQQC